jgi:hypothetical protein
VRSIISLGEVLLFGEEIGIAEEEVVAISQDMQEIWRERSHSAAVKDPSLYVRSSISFPSLLE